MAHQVIKRKGIEPIVATILLVAIAIVSAILIYLWVSKLIAQQTSTGNGGVSPSVNVLSVSYVASNGKYKVMIFLQAPTQPNVESASILTVSGSVVEVVKSSSIYVTQEASGVYNVTLVLSSSLSPGVYYCELYTTDYGIIVTPSFGVS